MSATAALARTPLWPRHQAAGAKLVPFAGFDMPVVYTSILDEHRAVRTRAGLFDVSHMGEVRLRGEGAIELAQVLLTNDVVGAPIGRVRYGMLCQDDGGVVDDVTAYRTGEREVLFCVNASNIAADLAWMRELHARTRSRCELIDECDATALLAIQGPEALGIVAKLLPDGWNPPKLWHFAAARLAGQVDVLLSRTGYTGEDGFEVFAPAERIVAVWDAVLAAASGAGGMACGLAARDTLRLEAGLPLCGSDMDRSTTPLEAGLGWVVKLGKPDFVGRPALVAQRDRGVPRRLVGLVMDEAGVPRHGFAVYAGDERVGHVTSGTKSPTLDTFIAMAYVPAALAAPGTAVAVDVRGRRHAARVVQRPFYRRAP